jgi:adenylosuccinate synthase
MHLDTLSGFERVGICTGYRLDGETITSFPGSVQRLAAAEPVYEFVPGWQEELRQVRRFEDLPATAQAYVRRIEELTEVPVSLASVGPDRAETIVRGELARLLDRC